MVRKSKPRFQEWAKINRRNEKRDREYAEFLDNADLKLADNLPKSRTAFENLYHYHTFRLNGRGTGVSAFFRHQLTNYDRILDDAQKRFPGVPTPWDAKQRLSARAAVLCRKYLLSIGAIDLLRKRVIHGKKQIKRIKGEN